MKNFSAPDACRSGWSFVFVVAVFADMEAVAEYALVHAEVLAVSFFHAQRGFFRRIIGGIGDLRLAAALAYVGIDAEHAPRIARDEKVVKRSAQGKLISERLKQIGWFNHEWSSGG